MRMKYGYPILGTVAVFLGIMVGLLLLVGGTSYAKDAAERPVPQLVEAQGMATQTNLKVAFIADQGISTDAKAVLELIKREGAHLVIHQGDFGYGNESETQRAIDWDNQINEILGSNFPYFGVVGNHDVKSWNKYQQLLQIRLDNVELAEGGVVCTGDLGVRSACHYRGLFFLLSGAGTMGGAHAEYLRDQLAQDDSIWSICSWHKNQQEMQIGGKGSEVGWGPYEECRAGGALIATGHEHSYERTMTLINTQTQTVDPNEPGPPVPSSVRVGNGSSFVFVSGLGGQSERDQKRCLPTSYPYGCKKEWASIYATDQGAKPGALFIEFNVNSNERQAYGYFMNIDNQVIDSFSITVPSVNQTITGIVKDESGHQIVGAVVTTDNGQSGTTDGTGAYTIQHVPAGIRTLTASAVNFANGTQQVEVKLGVAVTPALDFVLVPGDGGGTTAGGTIKGKVTNEAGGRLAGAVVVVAETNLSDTTNKGGAYAFYDIVPTGARKVTASLSGYEPQTKDVPVDEGGTYRVDFILVPSGGGSGGGDGSGGVTGSISGTVTDSDGKLLGRVKMATDAGQQAKTDGRGRYTLKDVVAGEGIVVYASKPGYAEMKQENVTVNAGQKTAGVDFEMSSSP